MGESAKADKSVHGPADANQAASKAREALQKANSQSQSIKAFGIASWHWNTVDDSISWLSDDEALCILCTTGDALIELISPEDREEFNARVHAALELTEPQQMKLRVLDRRGQLRSYLWSGQAIFGSESKVGAPPNQLFGTLVDIERYQGLRERSDHLTLQKRALLENLPDVAWMKDVEGRFTAVNRPFCERFGLDPDHAEGKTDLDIYPQEKADAIRRDDERVISSGQPVRYESCHIVDGCENWVEVLKRPIFDGEGRVLGTVGASRDISARKAAERELVSTTRELERAKERLQLALEGSQLVLWDTDLVSGDIYLSEGWASLVGLPPGATHTSMQELMMLVHPEDKPGLLAASREAISGTRSEYLVEHRIRTTDGQWKWILSRGKVTQRDPNGQVRRMSGTNMDITDRKSMETQLKGARDNADAANRAKSGFLANMSHEIRTPMSGVLGMMELLQMSPLTNEQREIARMAHESATALLRLIDDILDFSKIEANQLEIHSEPVSVRKLAHQSVSIYKEIAARKRLPLDFIIDPDLSDFYTSDALRLSQIINNLLSNAIKFTDTGKVSLDIGVKEHREKADLVRIRVADTGIGIPASLQAHLFRPFSQADSSTARKYGGTGLGLSICQRLVSIMGGAIQMESTEGKGTVMTVEIELPVSKTTGKNIVDTDILHGYPSGAPGGRRVLVVDDHPINLNLLLRQLHILGYEVDSAADGAEALLKWRAGHQELILTDCHMPNMDGYELARAIRKEESLRGDTPIPIVACTASAVSGESELCLAAGMNDYLTKPVSISALRRMLDQWLPADVPKDNQEAPLESPTLDSLVAPLNRTALEQFTNGDKDIERGIFSQFLDATRADAQTLREALKEKDVLAGTKAAHRIKGSSRMMGANPVAELAEQIEKSGKNGDVTQMINLLPIFEDEHVRLVSWLERAVTGDA